MLNPEVVSEGTGICDSAVIIGKKHEICQDYTGHGAHYVLLADGCSGSEDSDFGARFLVKAASNLLADSELELDRHFPLAVLSKARGYREGLGLKEESLDATFLAAIYRKESLHLFCAGDGVLVVGHKNGEVHIFRINYPGGYPFYLNYLDNPTRLEGFRFHNPVPVVEYSGLDTSGNFSEIFEKHPGERHYFYSKIDPSPIRYAAIFSDGVEALTVRERQGSRKVGFLEVLEQLLEFYSIKGRYVLRKLKGLEKNCRSENREINDDLSMGAIMFT